MNVYEKLLQVQQKLKAPKNQYNKFGDFNYRNCEDILEAAKPLLAEVSAVLLISDEVITVGNRYYIKATATLQDTESQESISNIAYAREGEERPKMDVAQITGSSSSYARKYALNGLFCIDDTKDPDTRNNEVAPAQPAAHSGRSSGSGRQQGNVKVKKAEIDRIKSEAIRTGTDLSKVCTRYIVNTIEELTQEQYMKAMAAFRKMPTVAEPYQPDFMGAITEDVPFR